MENQLIDALDNGLNDNLSNGLKAQAIVLLSGGLDSATCAAQAIADGYQVVALFV